MDFPELGGDEEDRTLDLTDANRTLSRMARKTGPNTFGNMLKVTLSVYSHIA